MIRKIENHDNAEDDSSHIADAFACNFKQALYGINLGKEFKLSMVKEGDGFRLMIHGAKTKSSLTEQYKYIQEDDIKEIVGVKSKDVSRVDPLFMAVIDRLSSDELLLGLMETKKTLRGKGLGSIFVHVLNDVAKKRGFRFVTAVESSVESAKFFIKNGFRELREFDNSIAVFLPRTLNEVDETFLCTVYLLKEEDEEMIRLDKAVASIEDRIMFMKSVFSAECLISEMARIIEMVEDGSIRDISKMEMVLTVIEKLSVILNVTGWEVPLMDDGIIKKTRYKMIMSYLRFRLADIAMWVPLETLEELRESLK
jgi:GNAT superfamily N-acetyltransferase